MEKERGTKLDMQYGERITEQFQREKLEELLSQCTVAQRELRKRFREWWDTQAGVQDRTIYQRIQQAFYAGAALSQGGEGPRDVEEWFAKEFPSDKLTPFLLHVLERFARAERPQLSVEQVRKKIANAVDAAFYAISKGDFYGYRKIYAEHIQKVNNLVCDALLVSPAEQTGSPSHPHLMNDENDRCVMCGRNAFNRERNPNW